MLIRPTFKKTYSQLFILFPLMVLAAAAVVWNSLESVKGVSASAQGLISHKLPEMRELMALQDRLSRGLVAMHQYYATTEHAGEVEKQLAAARVHLRGLKQQGGYDEEIATVLAHLDRLEAAYLAFDAEMRGSGPPDWDQLRSDLATADVYAKLAQQELSAWSAWLRSEVAGVGMRTLDGVHRLNTLQVGFAFVVLFVVALLMAFLFVRVRDQARLYHRAYHDELTDLPNRRALLKFGGGQILGNPEKPRGILWLSLDRLPMISGTFGYTMGDRLLKQFSHNLEMLLERSDYAARLFGLGRGLWVVCIDLEGKKDLGRGLLSQIELMTQLPMTVEGREFNVACSIGGCRFPEDGQSVPDLLRKADTARRAAYAAGGNAYRGYQKSMTEAAERCLSIEAELRLAFGNNELELHYQPKLAADGGTVVSAEALVRWRKDGKLRSPAMFVSVAEQTGQILALGEWVLENACRQWVAWQHAGFEAPQVAVNISAQQFQDPAFPSFVQRILEATGMPASRLELEITEEAANENPESVIETMQWLRHIGVSLAIDDFGTGYSSLAYLKRLPVDVLKVDRSFIQQIDQSERERAIVSMVVNLAHELNFKVVAEGVESESQAAILRAMHCDQLQGFLYSKPLPAPEFQAFCKAEAEPEKISRIS